MYEERSWNCVETTTGLLTCSIPMVLKQALFELLAALATDEICAVNIWNCLLCEGICVQKCSMLGEKLGEIQRDLEEQEANLKVYNCTQGFLTLLRFSFRTKRVQTVTNWLHLSSSLSIPCCEPLKTFYATPIVVQNKATEVQILAQLLSDSPLSRSILQIIVEGADRLRENAPVNPSRDDATFSAIRLFYMAISHRTAMAMPFEWPIPTLWLCLWSLFSSPSFPTRAVPISITFLCCSIVLVNLTRGSFCPSFFEYEDFPKDRQQQ
ncbi:hypothetical protein niasHT_011365 [Heterodera trifolii]|uniref:Uncharacterized protein n=1 Tax=Heterodera trifolii TaxID=157864 RepID=A0ABD2LID0_9BILA